jgi:large subunit ribosomal protein L17
MLANMATSLILHKRITTTTAKAKALRTYIEPLITKSKEDSTHSRRVIFSYLQNKTAVAELFREVSPKIAERPGGYTRILKTGNRIGDNAEMCILELVDFNENMLGGEATKGKTTRRRKTTRKKGEETTTTVKARKNEAPAAEAETAPEETGKEETEKSE